MQLYDGLEEVLATEEFGELLRRIEALAVHHERQVLEAADNKPLESVRYAAGRLTGVRLVLDLLTNARKAVKDVH